MDKAWTKERQKREGEDKEEGQMKKMNEKTRETNVIDSWGEVMYEYVCLYAYIIYVCSPRAFCTSVWEVRLVATATNESITSLNIHSMCSSHLPALAL